ncbi:MAG TPA: glycosyltransferase [Phycisphaerae bacterium]|nr:glycosyltransferase [Phycisphaerales bacterium]HRX86057.1 glycosyltransferase [Phycisphaerae bacterium]
MGELQSRRLESDGGNAASDPVILHVVHTLEHGGTERFLCQLLNRLAGHGMRHVVCTLRAAGARAEQLDRRITVHALNLPDRSPTGFLRLARIIRQEGAGVVHARNPGTWTDTLLAGRVARRPRLALGFHGLQAQAQFDVSLRRRLRALGSLRHTFTTVSHAGKAQLVDDLGCHPEAIHVLGNGVDPYRFRPPTPQQQRSARGRLGVGPDELAIGTVGNLFSPVKGHRVLIDAMSRLLQAVPYARLLLAGFGPLRDELEAQAGSLGIAERVHFLGDLANPAELLAALDLYVCPSLSEGMSNALLEAMSCGRACVATDVADHRRMFQRIAAVDLLVPPNDAEALAAAMQRVLQDAALRETLGTAARRRVETDYPFEQAVAGYARFYRSLLPDTPLGVAPDDPVEVSRCLS